VSITVSPQRHSRGNKVFVTMLRSLTHIQARLADLALTPLPGTRSEFRNSLLKTLKRGQRVVKLSGFKPIDPRGGEFGIDNHGRKN
jgi:hypothetical protein